MIVPLIAPGLLALLISPSPSPAAPQDERAAYLGTYSYIKGMRGGQQVPEEDLKGRKVELEDGELSLIGPDGTEEFEIKVTLDSEPDDQGVVKFTMEITESSLFAEAVGAKAKGLGKYEDGTITLIYDFAENASHPDDFEPEGPTQHLFVIKKVPDSDTNDDDDNDDDDPRS
ncbi:hypothetical protein [Tautonia sociabilis]|uniref:TIGR03067 domain-containing protein n=1 Tax=Tautonia sociabilis TaxID=2080755 RepID=A0A432MMH2_9BACT|nr:hypothetical protein [Tautonia sociabilis]RUL88644.1 hypothetical protein TsocGM_05765 [Tautonia sociabilis]